MDTLGRILGGGVTNGPLTPFEIVGAIGLSFLLTIAIAAVYRRTHRGTFYTQDYVHTLIILGMVVTAVIMVVGQSLERAFAVFAAFSIIRFRRSVPETRDIGFIFFAMAVGMAAGARQYSLAVLTTLLIGAAVLLIARFDLFAPRRATHSLRIRVANSVDFDRAYQEAFRMLFERVELRAVESAQAKTMTELRYAVSLRPGIGHRDVITELGRAGVDRVLMLERDYEAGGRGGGRMARRPGGRVFRSRRSIHARPRPVRRAGRPAATRRRFCRRPWTSRARSSTRSC